MDEVVPQLLWQPGDLRCGAGLRGALNSLSQPRRQVATRRLLVLASHVVPEQIGSLLSNASQSDIPTELGPSTFDNTSMIVPSPGTAAFHEWMQILYEQAQMDHSTQQLVLPSSRCLGTLREWLIATEDCQPPASRLGDANLAAASLSRRLRVMAQHVPQIADRGFMMSRGGSL